MAALKRKKQLKEQGGFIFPSIQKINNQKSFKLCRTNPPSSKFTGLQAVTHANWWHASAAAASSRRSGATASTPRWQSWRGWSQQPVRSRAAPSWRRLRFSSWLWIIWRCCMLKVGTVLFLDVISQYCKKVFARAVGTWQEATEGTSGVFSQ